MKALIGLVVGTIVAGMTAHAQVELTITGSTAFRTVTIDRCAYLFDSGFTAITNDTASPNLITIRGTMQSKIASLGTTPVTLRLGFSGSGSGMLAVKNLTPVTVADTAGNLTTGNITKVPDLALSDIYPASATPPIAESAFNRSVLGVIPFIFAANKASSITNLTRDQAYLLMTASGTISGFPGMPQSFLGGTGANAANPVYLTGRDSGSGTRITVHKVLGFTGTPSLWATDAGGNWVSSAGLSSGGTERGVISAKADAIGYLGLADFAKIAATANMCSYNGVPYTEPNVANGLYTMWGYEHIVNRAGALSANQTAIRNALVTAITDSTFQATAIYADSFVRMDQMTVERGADGGPITSLNW